MPGLVRKCTRGNGGRSLQGEHQDCRCRKAAEAEAERCDSAEGPAAASAGKAHRIQEYRSRGLDERYRVLLAGWWLRAGEEGFHDEAGGDRRGSEEIRAAWTWWRGFPLRRQVGLHQARRPEADLSHLQR